jgi:hypothetical protein
MFGGEMQDVVEIRRSIVFFSQSRLVVVRRLTPLHRLIGWTYGLVFKPAFLVRRRLQGFDEALGTIVEKASKREA